MDVNALRTICDLHHHSKIPSRIHPVILPPNGRRRPHISQWLHLHPPIPNRTHMTTTTIRNLRATSRMSPVPNLRVASHRLKLCALPTSAKLHPPRRRPSSPILSQFQKTKGALPACAPLRRPAKFFPLHRQNSPLMLRPPHSLRNPHELLPRIKGRYQCPLFPVRPPVRINLHPLP